MYYYMFYNSTRVLSKYSFMYIQIQYEQSVSCSLHNLSCYHWKLNFPMNPHVRLLVRLLVVSAVCHIFLKGYTSMLLSKH